LRHPGSGQETR